MFRRASRLFASLIALGTTAAAVRAGDDPTPRDLPGWGHVLDPSRDCDVSLDVELNRLRITVPGTPHVLSAEVPQLPMNAPRVIRRVRGNFTADVRVLGRLEPGRTRTTHYDPYHGAGLIVWQDPSNYLRLERAVGLINGRHHPYINYELRAGGLLAVTRGFTIEDGPLWLKLRRQGEAYSAWYSYDGRRWFALRRIDATFADRVEVGVVAVNSAEQTLSAELEMLNIEDPQGSKARDYADPDPGGPSRPPPASSEGPQFRPRRVAQGSQTQDDADRHPGGSSRPPPASSEDFQVRPKRMSVLFDAAPRKKPPARQTAPIRTEPTGFHW
jgi:regulation of enolase protein 1 (concanavalin A-like superfamily)